MGGRVGEWAGAGQQATAMPHTRLYAGERLRALRRGLGLGQPAMAARLGLSVSYLSQLENDARPLTAAVITALRRHHPAETAALEGEAPARRMGALSDALTDPVLDAPLAPDRSEAHTSELQSLMRISYAVL